MATRLLLLIPTKSYRTHDFMSAAEKLGLELVIATNQPQTLTDLAPGKILILDFNKPDEASQTILQWTQQKRLDAIVPVDEEGTIVAARAAEILQLPGNTVESVRAARDKQRMRERLTEASLLQPQFQVVATTTDPATIAVTFPAVIKPLFLSASRGVMRVDTPEEFCTAFHRLKKILIDPDVVAISGKLAEKILIESFIPRAEGRFSRRNGFGAGKDKS